MTMMAAIQTNSVMEGKKKRKVDSECRLFNEEWGVKYFFVQAGDKALCVICNENVAVLKEYNVRRHYEIKHEPSYSQFTGTQRSEKFESMQRRLLSQQVFFTQKITENEALTRASYKLAYGLAKRGKPLTDGDLIKECIMEAVEELCPEKANLFKIISLAPNTVAHRIEGIGSNIFHQIADKEKNFQLYSLALDESTDVCDTSQLLVFIRGVDSEFNVTQELASVHSMHSTVTGEDIFKELQKTVLEYNLEWNKLQCVTIDWRKERHGSTVVSTAASQLQGPGFDSRLGSLSVWSLHILLVSVWVSSGCSGFLPQSKDVRVRLIGQVKKNCPLESWDV
ncbi:general transcription factor II-I repeat domain-containing protein 2-like [Mustelus asterias]